jgi:hypothetical protein
MVAKLTALNLRQIIIPGPVHLFHEDHPSDPTRGGAWGESMWPSFLDELLSVARGDQAPAGETPFGLGRLSLPEHKL